MSSIDITLDVSDEIIEDIIEGAGYAIGYWTTECVFDSQAQTYTITDSEEGETFRLTYSDITKAIHKLVKGEVDIRKDITQGIAIDLMDYANGCHMDSEAYDCIIQVACFNKVIYG